MKSRDGVYIKSNDRYLSFIFHISMKLSDFGCIALIEKRTAFRWIFIKFIKYTFVISYRKSIYQYMPKFSEKQ